MILVDSDFGVLGYDPWLERIVSMTNLPSMCLDSSGRITQSFTFIDPTTNKWFWNKCMYPRDMN